MNLNDAKAMFSAGQSSPAENLYEAAYAYSQAQGVDPMESGDWKNVRMLLDTIGFSAGAPIEIINEAFRLWQIDSNCKPLSIISEETGYDDRFLRNEIKSGRLEGKKFGSQWSVTRRALRKWLAKPRRGSRKKT